MRAQADDPVKATYVGVEVCAGCHQAQAERWKTSHHALAMEKATPATVLGDFSGVSVENFGVVSTFSRVGDKFMVRTDGPDGALHDYEITYTFGIDPLQQYLIGFPDGRYQMLGIRLGHAPEGQGRSALVSPLPRRKAPAGLASALDRPRPDLELPVRRLPYYGSEEELRSIGQHLRHHLGQSRRNLRGLPSPGIPPCGMGEERTGPAPVDKSGLPDKALMGLEAWLKATDHGKWEMDPATGTARRTEPLASTQLNALRPCHSRRHLLAKGLAPDAPFLDAALPSLLVPGQYHADGQIDGEVFEYDSFLQSAMHKAGVVCSNCHEPHAAKLRAEGNALCAQCHLPEKFDVTAHHKHSSGSTGAQCVNCHMPTKNYMVVHDRRDHSMRVPRPDLSVSIGTPNACTQCHADRSSRMGGEGRRRMVSERPPDHATLTAQRSMPAVAAPSMRNANSIN